MNDSPHKGSPSFGGSSHRQTADRQMTALIPKLCLLATRSCGDTPSDKTDRQDKGSCFGLFIFLQGTRQPVFDNLILFLCLKYHFHIIFLNLGTWIFINPLWVLGWGYVWSKMYTFHSENRMPKVWVKSLERLIQAFRSIYSWFPGLQRSEIPGYFQFFQGIFS